MRWLLAAMLWIPGASGAVLSAQEQRQAVTAAWFEEHVRPVLATKCIKCHGPAKQEGSLRLDSLAAMLEGGDSGPAVVKGNPTESLLIEAIRYESLEMPPTGQLAARDIEHLERWIADNAPWPDHQSQIRDSLPTITPADQDWWAFRPLANPAVPRLAEDTWSQNPIDRFVYRKLAEQGMEPAPRAKKNELARRLYYGLLGLPPSPRQLDEFLSDTAPDAYARLIDQLLTDQRYGEHWARHWLDVVRYAESDGWNQDAYRTDIWRYRDYVVRSLNEDKPYPQFVREQLAGDELPGDEPDQLVATGFLRLGIYEYNQRDARSHWDDIMNELTDVTGDVFLGMGMACARCHDHKFDPLLQADYFQLRAFFEPIVWRDDIPYADQPGMNAYQAQQARWEAATSDIRAAIDALLQPYHDRKWESTVDKFPLDIQACFHKPIEERSSWDHQMAYLVGRQFYEEGGGPLKNMKKEDREKYEDLQQELAGYDHLKPQPLPGLMTASDFWGTVSPTVIPGDPERRPIEPGFLTVLARTPTPVPAEIPAVDGSTGRRTALAKWIGRPDNPLTTRVIVNRIWQQHFGEGIVSTPNDFGHLGQPPSHPELLDWLTRKFVEGGWSLKKLHKLILMSETWRQSSQHPRAVEYQAKDPAEQLLWRARVRRLTAEQLRDAMLSVSGELEPTIGGPSVDAESNRRSLYVKSFRNTPSELLHAFDAANGLKSVAQRNTTTTPTQSLLMINGDYPLGRAEKLAERLLALDLATPLETLEVAFRMTWGRPPSEAEQRSALRFLHVLTEPDQERWRRERWIDLCHVLLNSNEFMYLD